MSAGSQILPGPAAKYSPEQSLLNWMSDQFERFGNTFQASVYGTSVYVSRNPADAQHVLRGNWRNYTKGQAIKRVAMLLGNGLMVSEGEFWKSQRRMIQPAFHRKAIGAPTAVIRTSNLRLLERWEHAASQRVSINVTHDISGMVLEVTLAAIFGDDYEQVAPHFKILSDESARNLEFAQTFRSLGKVVLQVIAKRRKKEAPAEDILGMLMGARDQKTGEAMLDRQLVNEIRTLIVAGHETTASTLNWIWYLLSQHPEVEDRLSRELNHLRGKKFPDLSDLPKFTYARQVIEEALRLYPAGWLLTRRALKDDQLGDYLVPAGTEVYISPYFIQRHPDLWNEPDRFDPDRFSPARSRERHPFAMLPFSSGPRNCIGEFFARTEMQIHLVIIARRLQMKLVGKKPPELDAGVNLRSKSDFIMKPARKASANG